MAVPTLQPEGPLALAIGGTRFLLGATTYAAPSVAAALFSVDVSKNPQAPFIARLFAVRDAAIGVGTLTARGSSLRAVTAIGLAGDVGDALAAVLAYRRAVIPRSTAVSTVATAVLVGGLSTALYIRSNRA
jgi:hypothetical protein